MSAMGRKLLLKLTAEMGGMRTFATCDIMEAPLQPEALGVSIRWF